MRVFFNYTDEMGRELEIEVEIPRDETTYTIEELKTKLIETVRELVALSRTYSR